MTDRAQWSRRAGKRPLQVDGRLASTTDRATWASHSAVAASSVGDGFGFMLGDGIGCIDLDHAIRPGGELTARARAILDRCPATFVEVSMSGTGLHVFGLIPEGPGRGQRAGDHIERYSRARFIAMTGRPWLGSVPRLADLSSIAASL